MTRIIPAILTADIAEARMQMESVKEKTDFFQIDITDGKFVKSSTFLLSDLAQLPLFGKYEIHLMVDNPTTYLEDCKSVQAECVFFHMESKENPRAVLKHMEEYAFEKGIVLNPATPVSTLVPLKHNIDRVLIMGVNPGLQGQPLMRETLLKIQQVKELAPNLVVGMDGGINKDNLLSIAKAGADFAVVGSGIFNTKDPAAAIKSLQDII